MSKYEIYKYTYIDDSRLRCMYYKYINIIDYKEIITYSQPTYALRYTPIPYEALPPNMISIADAMYEGEDYDPDPRYYCQMTEVE